VCQDVAPGQRLYTGVTRAAKRLCVVV
jgi:hypothetical protein